MSKVDPISATQTPEPNSGSAGEFSSNLGRALFQQRIEAVLLATKVSTGADGVAVSLREGSVYICLASVGCAPEIGVTVEPGQGICGRCIASAQAIVEQNLAGEIKSVAAVPVMKDGQVIGFVAGFSLEATAFPQTAVDSFRQLADAIQNEVDPPLEIRLKPESEDEEDDLLSQLGIVAPGSVKADDNATLEDDSFLTDLVREVLEDAPSSAAPLRDAHTKNAEPDMPPAPLVSRSTEEVLMEVVPHIQAAPPPPPQTKLPVPPPQGIKSGANGAAAKPAFAREPKESKEKETPKPQVASVKSDAPAANPEEDSRESSANWTPTRIAVLLLVVLLTVGLVFYFKYFYKSAQPQSPSVQASTPVGTAKPDVVAQTPQTPTPNKPQEHALTTDGPKKTEQVLPAKTSKSPIVVASSNAPRRPVTGGDEQPVALSGVGANISAPDLPSVSSSVVFGGHRSTGATAAKLIQKVEPNFPPMARSMHLNGSVKLEAVVGPDGRVKSIRTVSGSEILAAAAADAVRRWRYQPAKQNGTPIESIVEVNVNFR